MRYRNTVMRMLNAPTSLLMWVFVCACGAAGLSGQEPKVQRPTEPVILATTVYASPDGPHNLSVWRRDLEGTPAATLQYLTKHPDRNALPNVVLYAVDSPLSSPSSGRVVWAAYDYFASNARPWPTWAADVTVHPFSRQIHLALMKTVSIRATLSLFEIPRDASIAPYPPTWSIAGIEQWPDAPKPVATRELESGDDVCTPMSLGMVPTARGVLMSVLREPGRCSSVHLEYDVVAKTWRDATVTPR